jgi:predicted lipase
MVRYGDFKMSKWAPNHALITLCPRWCMHGFVWDWINVIESFGYKKPCYTWWSELGYW